MADNTLSGLISDGGSSSTTQTDATFTIVNSSNVSKRAKFSCASISAGTTRTMTFPDASTTLAGIDIAQTLSNKIIADASNTIQWSYAIFSSSSWTTPIASKSYTFHIHKLGNIVTLTFPTVTGTTNSTNGFSILAALSAGQRPATQLEIPYRARNSTYGTGLLIIATNGDINFYSDMAGSIWPTGPVAFEIRGFTVSYPTAFS